MKFEYVERVCPVCGSQKNELAFEYDQTCRLMDDSVVWSVKNLICLECGFVYASPVPTDEALGEYYSKSWAYVFQDYSTDSRIALIDKALTLAGRDTKEGLAYSEIGANNKMPYHEVLEDRFVKVDRFDINTTTDSVVMDLNDTGSEPADRYDIVTAYYVLEHVSDPEAFLLDCKRYSDLIIIEIPDLYEYKYDKSGLELHEHLNHFSPRTLSLLADKVGLDVVHMSKTMCSRDFGTAYVLIDRASVSSSHENIEVQYARECVARGHMLMAEEEARHSLVRDRISEDIKNGVRVVAWCANEVSRSVLGEADFDLALLSVVDSNPGKELFFNDLGVERIYHPDGAVGKDCIAFADKFYIFSSIHFDAIVETIASMNGVDVESVNAVMV